MTMKLQVTPKAQRTLPPLVAGFVLAVCAPAAHAAHAAVTAGSGPSHFGPPVMCTGSYARHATHARHHAVCGKRTHPPCRMRVLACLRRPL